MAKDLIILSRAKKIDVTHHLIDDYMDIWILSCRMNVTGHVTDREDILIKHWSEWIGRMSDQCCQENLWTHSPAMGQKEPGVTGFLVGPDGGWALPIKWEGFPFLKSELGVPTMRECTKVFVLTFLVSLSSWRRNAVWCQRRQQLTLTSSPTKVCSSEDRN